MEGHTELELGFDEWRTAENEADWIEEEEGKKEEMGDSTLNTIHKLQTCCNTMIEFHKQGIEIKDVAVKAGAYIKDLIGDKDTINVKVERDKEVVVVDLVEDADEGKMIKPSCTRE